MPEIDDVLTRLTSRKGASCGDGVGSEEIKAAESTLGVSFDEQVNTYLTRCGWIEFDHDEPLGLGGDPAHENISRVTLDERAFWQERIGRDEFPDAWVPILRDGRGGFWLIDTSGTPNAILYFDHELMEAEPMATSMAHWLSHYLERGSLFTTWRQESWLKRLVRRMIS